MSHTRHVSGCLILLGQAAQNSQILLPYNLLIYFAGACCWVLDPAHYSSWQEGDD